MHLINILGSTMTNKKRKTFSPEFRLESAQLVVDQGHTIVEAAKAMGVSTSAMDRWVKQLKQERNGSATKASPITPEHIEIRELRKRIAQLEEHNTILKKATALLMSDSMNGSR
jgi:transposase